MTADGVGEWTARVVPEIRTRLLALAEPERAAPMRAYMRDQFPFLGVTTDRRRAAVRAVLADAPRPPAGANDILDAAATLWAMPEREWTYAACDLLARSVRMLPASAVDGAVRDLLLTRPWWDSVDALAGGTIRPMVVRMPGLVSVMRAWADSGDRWLIRVAITHQLGRRAGTDADLLFALCAQHGADREFFIAKAVGWALRDYARTAPADVAAFVAAQPHLAPVARREALKHLT